MRLSKSISTSDILGHPRGLYILFFTEMWERFSFYGMRAILVLYIYQPVEKQGLGWDVKEALWLYGWYTMFVYLLSIPGGLIADRFIGQKKAVMYGCILLCVGHWIMAVPYNYAFWSALVFIVMGVGMLKPNISSMVGSLYSKFDPRREQGFTIFYMGINLGALLASIGVAVVESYFGWHAAFGLAGLGMLMGLVIYWYGQKYLEGVGELTMRDRVLMNKKTKRESISVGQGIQNFFSDIMNNNLALIFTLIFVSIAGYEFVANSPLSGVMILAISLFVTYGIIVHSSLNMIERNRLLVLFVLFVVIVVYTGGFEQGGGLLNLYTDKHIDRSIFNFRMPTAAFQGANPFFIILLGPLVAWFWSKLGRKNKEVSAIFKIGVGLIILSIAFLLMVGATSEGSTIPFGQAGIYWIILFYLCATIAELSIMPVMLTFITRLAPKQYASMIMGVFFAVVGLGNKLAATIGEAAHGEHIRAHLVENSVIHKSVPLDKIMEDSSFTLKVNVFIEDGEIMFEDFVTGEDISYIMEFDTHYYRMLRQVLKEQKSNVTNPAHTELSFQKEKESLEGEVYSEGDGKGYWSEVDIEEAESHYQYEVFIFLFFLIIGVGFFVLFNIKKLKKLTHGAEDISINDNNERNKKSKSQELSKEIS